MAEKETNWIKDIEFKDGRVEIFGVRHGIIDSATFYRIREGFKKIVGSATDRILHMAGKSHTKEFVKSVLEQSRIVRIASKFDWGKEKITKKISKILNQYGYGVAEIVKFDPENEMVLTLKDSIIGSFYEGEEDKPTCSYLAGLLAGGATAILGKDVDCKEVKCIGKGDDVCKFVAKPAEKFETGY